MRALVLSLTVAVGLVAGIVSSNFGCGSADAAFDCHEVCARYQECYDPAYDVSKCSSRCRTAAANDSAYKNQADACESCIDGTSCLAAPFACGASCGTIVPGPQ